MDGWPIGLPLGRFIALGHHLLLLSRPGQPSHPNSRQSIPILPQQPNPTFVPSLEQEKEPRNLCRTPLPTIVTCLDPKTPPAKAGSWAERISPGPPTWPASPAACSYPLSIPFSFLPFFPFAALVPSLNRPRRATLLAIFGLHQSHYASFARHDRLPPKDSGIGKTSKPGGACLDADQILNNRWISRSEHVNGPSTSLAS
ncbi:hypothetical protein LX32DRAFT_24422 [Colletotrichum zoysiae]|uniref:Uncharacterized protein n=1 Tax=Colletotrichum zoysiae TaxID=1216348 RepID=A0AAD9M8P1_9PEZI|nr:hypothetical protein LX32DRAFT_24422 [Colletotrichum zoysiae]